MPAKIYYDSDADLNVLKGKKIAIIGYGSQGHAQAQNLRDSGLDVIVADLQGTENYQKAIEDGFKPVSAAEASKQADIIQMLVEDEAQPKVYKNEVEPHLQPGNALLFSHGFNIHFGQIVPLFGREIALQGQLTQPDDGVHGRADLVAHAG